jgi:pimeloyl-[acyl-carrier protein] methyl ester esterase
MTDVLPLLVLPGALDDLEGSDVAAERISGSRRVIRVAYRAEDTFAALVERVLAAAAESGATQWDLLGQSYGGWIAQCVARLHPEKVRHLVLSHSFVLTARDAWRLRLASHLFQHIPMVLMRPLLMARVRHALAPLAKADSAGAERRIARLAEALVQTDLREKLTGQQRIMGESLRWPLPPIRANLPVLLIEGDNDPVIPASARRMLRACYPQAAVRSFAGAGHISALVQTRAYVDSVNAFLDA